MSTIHAKDSIVYLQGSGSDAITLTEAGDVSIDIDYDLEADTAFGDTWETQLKGILRWSGSIAGNFDTAQALLFDALGQSTPRKMYVYPARGTAARYYYGTVWPKLGVTLPFGVGKFSTSFTGDGQLAIN